MEIGGQRSRNRSRTPVTGTIGNQETNPAGKRVNLPVDRIGAITPAAMQENDGRASTNFAVMNFQWRTSRSMRRGWQLYDGHSKPYLGIDSDPCVNPHPL